jgi:hypothetical protein
MGWNRSGHPYFQQIIHAVDHLKDKIALLFFGYGAEGREAFGSV